MNLKNISLFALGLAISLSTLRADTLIDTWSTEGGAWTPGNQPDFSTSSGGILYTDEAIASDTNNSTDNTGATWTSSVTAGSGIYTDYYYTSSSTPTVVLSTENILSDINTITLVLVSNGGSFPLLTSASVTLSYGGDAVAFTSFSSPAAGVVEGFNMYAYTWTWNVSALEEAANFSLTIATASNHTAYASATLTQSTVPEPSTYALLGMGLASLLWIVRRRQVALS